MFPNQVQFALHTGAFAGDRNNSVLFRQDNGELSESSVSAKSIVPAAPELVAVALVPIAFALQFLQLGAGLLDFEAGGFLDPIGRNKLLSVPNTFLQI